MLFSSPTPHPPSSHSNKVKGGDTWITVSIRLSTSPCAQALSRRDLLNCSNLMWWSIMMSQSHVQTLGWCRQGHGEGLCNQNRIISAVFSQLIIILLQPGGRKSSAKLYSENIRYVQVQGHSKGSTCQLTFVQIIAFETFCFVFCFWGRCIVCVCACLCVWVSLHVCECDCILSLCVW